MNGFATGMTVDLERKMAQLEVKLLRAQFNSHFLFNNLNAINYRILQNDPQTASAYLTLFRG
jgi:LytS/YehU family sensor histidine kinase